MGNERMIEVGQLRLEPYGIKLFISHDRSILLHGSVYILEGLDGVSLPAELLNEIDALGTV